MLMKKNLVKKIEVMSVIKENDYNNAFIHVVDIGVRGKKDLKTKLVLHKKLKEKYTPITFTLKHGDDLAVKTANHEYDGFKISEINLRYDFIKFTNGIKLKKGQVRCTDSKKLMHKQIENTIVEHFEKAKKTKVIKNKASISVFY